VTSDEIRKTFIEFFEKKSHKFVPSSPVAPQDDPTLLFVNAGMNQFKDVFLAKGSRSYSRAVNSQKCIRVSGKHNDLEEVGPSPIHHTFFEMLGNWSFGDYYKTEAIQWAWELLTDVFKLDKNRLYATVFIDDDESFRLWESETDIDPSHISRHGHKDNFWEMGVVGPCGPCSEIHYDLGEPLPGHESPPDDGPNSESGRFIELWNLVFIQYHRDASGKLNDLPQKHVDTGAGLERIARVMQGVNSNYETDLFAPIIREIAERSSVAYELNGIHIPHRVIADHLRSLSSAIADGALPGKEGRGYVLRRILRRASYYAREKLGVQGPFIYKLLPTLIDVMGSHFTELKQREKHIETVIKREEETFTRSLERGLMEFNALLAEGKSFDHFRDKGGKKWAVDMLRLVERSGLEGWENPVTHENAYNELVDSFTGLNDVITDSRHIENINKHIDYLSEVARNENRLNRNEQADLDDLIDNYIKWRRGTIIHGPEAFRLHDTFGFPIDLTQKIASDRGISVDMEGFQKELEAAKERSRAGSKFNVSVSRSRTEPKTGSTSGSRTGPKTESVSRSMGSEDFIVISEGDHSEFVGYDKLTSRSAIRKFRIIEGGWSDANNPEIKEKPLLGIVLERTPFYAESGGQVTDKGIIQGSETHLVVEEVQMDGDMRVHLCRATRLPKTENRFSGQVEAEVNKKRRNRILPHHTTTHLLQAALRKVLGDHISQAGSHVTTDYMTFDFTHFEKMTPEQVVEVEELVNRWIREDHPVTWKLIGLDTAKAEGVTALFGEKYDDVVRAVKIGDEKDSISYELCGGTHLARTGEAGLFRIESETALSAGVRRIEVTAGEAAYERTISERTTLNRVQDIIGSRGSDPADKLVKIMDRQKELQKEIERLQKAVLDGSIRFVEDWGQEIDFGGKKLLFVSGAYDAATDRDGLQNAGDKILADLKDSGIQGIGVIGALIEETFMFVCVVTEELVKQGIHAGKLVGTVAKKAGGGGGGKPGFATAGSRNHDEARLLIKDNKEMKNIIESFINDL